MEWERIEAKWHDMAQRMQHMRPVSREQIDAVTDAISRDDSQTPLAEPRAASDDTAPRATV